MEQSRLNLAAGRPPPTLAGGRYVITQVLGKGATALVYLGFDKRARIWRAIKVLLPQFLEDEQMLHRFRQEAETMTRLKHVNVLRVYDVLEDELTPGMVMELAPGGSLSGWLKKHGAMPPEIAGAVTLELCAGLEAAHASGIIHRDVKPHNVLLNRRGVCKLTDFGIAQVAEQISMTMTGSTMGTFAFMAPEQRNDAKSVDPRSDIYAVGATLFTLLKARVSTELFIAETNDKILQGIPEPLIRIILASTKYERDERYQTVAEMRADLELAVSELDAPTGEPPPLVEIHDVLPVRPPKLLPEGIRFLELERALGLDEDHPTYVPPKEEVERLLAPEGSSSPSNSTLPPPAGQERWRTTPSYLPNRLMEAQAGYEEQPTHIASSYRSVQKRRDEPEVRHEWTPDDPIGADPIEAPQNPDPANPRSLSGIVGGVAVLVGVLVCGGLGAGTAQVWSAQSAAGRAAEDLYKAIESESAIAYDLGQVRADAEAVFFSFQDGRGDAKLESAVQFVDLAETGGRALDPTSAAGIRRDILIKRRDAYHRARSDWEKAADGPLARLVIGIGVVRAPPQGPAGS